MKLGFVTYQIGKDWDVQQIIEKCQATGFEGAELRTTHAHGVEISLSAEERSTVRKQFEDAGVEIAGLGSSFDYHAVDASAVQESISGTIEYARLAADLPVFIRQSHAAFDLERIGELTAQEEQLWTL